MSNLFREWAENLKPHIDKELHLFLDESKQQCAWCHPFAIEVMDEVQRFTLMGGKRLRPIIMCLGYQCATGGEVPQQVIRMSVAWEIAQTYLLMHDDIIDKSEVRRWSETTYRRFAREYAASTTDSLHFGISSAILAGDLAAELSMSPILNAHDLTDDRKVAVLRYFMETIQSVCLGQILDTFSAIQHGSITEADILNIGRYKTASYTVEGPLRMGYMVGNGVQENYSSISNYAIPLGQAFQLRDDLLGLYGSDDKIGKSSKSDLREGKITLLVFKALEMGNHIQVGILRRALGNSCISDHDVDAVRQVVYATGAKEYVEECAVSLLQKAKQVVSSVTIDPYSQSLLESLADYLAQQ